MSTAMNPARPVSTSAPATRSTSGAGSPPASTPAAPVSITTRFDYDAARLSISASVATTWFQVLALQERLDIARGTSPPPSACCAWCRRATTTVRPRRSIWSQQRTTVLLTSKAIEPL